MDKRSVEEATQEAIGDLQIDCEVTDISYQSGKDEWCIQFSGKYGPFKGEFKNQFGKENNSRIIREKIKSHLIKQISKIRSSTGRKRKPALASAENGDETGGLLSTPLKMVEQMLDRAAKITKEVVGQASTVAEAARETVSDVAANVMPVTVEVRSTTRERKVRATSTKKKKSGKATKQGSSKAKKATKRVVAKAGKKAKKTIRSAARSSGNAAKKSQRVVGKAVSRATRKAKKTKKNSRPGK